jgi:hypothetical protein
VTRARVHGLKSKPVYFEARSGLPETSDALDQRGVIGGAGAGAPEAVWRQAHDRAQAARSRCPASSSCWDLRA